MAGLDPAINGSVSCWRRLEPGLQVGEDWVERGAECDQKTVGPLAVAFAADIALPETRDDAAQIAAVAANVAAVAQIVRPRGGIAVESQQHSRDIRVDVMEEAR